MNKYNTIGVDLAKNVIQVCVASAANKQLSNKELTRKKFAEFLIKQKPALVAFEACATAHYWSRVARQRLHLLGKGIKLIRTMRWLLPKRPGVPI